MKRCILIVCVFVSILLTTHLHAQVRPILSYQGFLSDTAGAVVPDGNYSLRFTVWDTSVAGSSLWTEQHSSIQVKNGLFTALLGSVDTLNITFPTDQPRYLEIAIVAGPGISSPITFSPRSLMTGAPYSIGNSSIAGGTGGISNAGSTTIAADIDSNGTGEIALQTGRVTRMTIANNGNVGIGTSIPSFPLEVNGDMRTSGDIKSGNSMYFRGTTHKITTTAVAGQTYSKQIRIGYDTQVDPGGSFADVKVGIGELNPLTTLDVSGTIKGNNLLIGAAPGGPSNRIASSTTPDGWPALMVVEHTPVAALTSGGYALTGRHANGAIGGRTAVGIYGVSDGETDSGGTNMGLYGVAHYNSKSIGVSALAQGGVSTNTGGLFSASGLFAINKGIEITLPNSGINNWSLYSSSTADAYFAGKVGVGTATPQGALDVNSTTGAFIVPRMTTTQRDALTAANGMIIYNTTTNQFNFRENGAWVIK